MSALHLPGTRIPIFGVRAHDTHHAIPNSNYGQYLMLWDYVMGTYRPHPRDKLPAATPRAPLPQQPERSLSKATPAAESETKATPVAESAANGTANGSGSAGATEDRLRMVDGAAYKEKGG